MTKPVPSLRRRAMSFMLSSGGSALFNDDRDPRELLFLVTQEYLKCVCQNGCKCCECDDARSALNHPHHNAENALSAEHDDRT